MNNNQNWSAQYNFSTEYGDPSRILFTTFQPPEPEHLIENILPDLLGINRTRTDSSESDLFYNELHNKLTSFKNRIAIFCSFPSADKPIHNHWLWTLLPLFHVGADGGAVQHAKLCMVLRSKVTPDEKAKEYLEIIISSTNLTESAIRTQLQAGWRCVVPLGKSRNSNLKSWDILPLFLEALGKKSEGTELIKPWIDEILTRCMCPENVGFIASVPGPHQLKKTVWGLTGINKINKTGKMHIYCMVPTVGSFTKSEITGYLKAIKVKPGRFKIAWFAKDSYPKWDDWVLPTNTFNSFKGKIGLLELPQRTPENDRIWQRLIHDNFIDRDNRWSHSKLYWLKSGRTNKLLITSANLSSSAWGQINKGGVYINNFELGVVVPVQSNPLDRLHELSSTPFTKYEEFSKPNDGIVWAQAIWDGIKIKIVCRISKHSHLEVKAEILSSQIKKLKFRIKWDKNSSKYETSIPWTKQALPLSVILMAEPGNNQVMIPVINKSSMDSLDITIYPEIKANQRECEKMELKLLEEKYGGRAADEEDPPDVRGTRIVKNPENTGGDLPPPADYGISVIEESRSKMGIVDDWLEQRNGSSQDMHSLIMADGKRLYILWRKKTDFSNVGEEIAHSMAIRELSVYLGEK